MPLQQSKMKESQSAALQVERKISIKSDSSQGK
jgi:hypothetical protein